MIEVIVRHMGSETELARIEIENVSTTDDGLYGNYSVRFGVNKVGGVGLHRRGVLHFPRTKYNVLALLIQALSTLDPQDLEFTEPWDERDPLQKLRELGRRWWRS